MSWFDKDPTSTEGADKLPYKIEDFDLKYSIIDPGVPVGWWNSVGSSFNAFYKESAIDEAAHSVNQDPYEFRLKLLNHQPRFKKVLNTVAENSKWGRTLSDFRGLGIAIHRTRGSIGAVVMEIALNESGNLSLEKAWIAIDCGRTINPDTVKAQMQGGFVFGLSACLSEEITLKNGRVEQSNFCIRVRPTCTKSNLTLIIKNDSWHLKWRKYFQNWLFWQLGDNRSGRAEIFSRSGRN